MNQTNDRLQPDIMLRVADREGKKVKLPQEL